MISLTNLKNRASTLAKTALNPRTPSVVREAVSNVSCSPKGFTLLELLIVIAIIAILSIALVFMLNPAETLKKARDAQRISDLKSVKTALGIMLTASSTPNLDNFAINGAVCSTNKDGGTQTASIAYSVNPAPTAGIAASSVGSDNFAATFAAAGYDSVTATSSGKVDGTGWIPVNLKALTGGTPISSFPVDPVNTIANGILPVSTDYVYRYACQNFSTTAGKPSYVFELDASLESNAYTTEDDKRSKDGGDNASYYETGNSLNLLPLTSAF